MRQEKTFSGDLNWKWYKETSNLNRHVIRMLTGFISGRHCRLKAHLSKLGMEYSLVSAGSEEEETVRHQYKFRRQRDFVLFLLIKLKCIFMICFFLMLNISIVFCNRETQIELRNSTAFFCKLDVGK